MKFTLICLHTDSGKLSAENHDKDHIETLQQAREWGKEQIEYFNDTLRPFEEERALEAILEGFFAYGINGGAVSYPAIKNRPSYEKYLKMENEAISKGDRSLAMLEGESIGDYEYGILKDCGFDIHKFEGLYHHQGKLHQLPKLDPDYIFIHTTGTAIGNRAVWRKQLKREFKSLQWFPKNVIFFNDTSAEAYIETARRMKQYGTRFFLMPSYIDNELQPATWI